MIEICNISKSFLEHQVLNNVSMSIPKQKIISLLGASGLGKSVLLHVLAGLIPYDSGGIFIDSLSVNHLDVSYMQQKDLLLPWYTVLQNASLPLIFTKASKKIIEEKVLSKLEFFGLKEFAGHYPSQLSGGMRQRVALLRTLLHEKPIILMDEPFSALDALTAQELRIFLKQLHKEKLFTLLFVTHNIEEALDLSDEIWLMQKSTPQLYRIESLSGSYEDKKKFLWKLLTTKS